MHVHRRKVFLVGVLLSTMPVFCPRAEISIRLDSYAQRRAAGIPLPLFSLPPEEWSQRYESESVVYVPGEKTHIRVEVSPSAQAVDGQTTLTLLLAGKKRVLHSGHLEPGVYGPYEVAISSDFEVYRVDVQAGDQIATKAFYGIRPWRGMKDFAEAVSPYGITLDYEKSTPWDVAVKEGVPLSAMDPNWALASHIGEDVARWEDWWLWTHYASGMVSLESGRTGLLWGEYNPWTPLKAVEKRSLKPREGIHLSSTFGDGALATDIMLPNEIYFRERIRPMLRKWAEDVGEEHPGKPLTVFLGDAWGSGRHYDADTLRFFVAWMKEQFGVSIEAETFRELIQKCREYPKHFEYFVARNTTLRSLELTCETMRDVVAGAMAYDRNGESARQLIAMPEAAEFCEILSRCIAVGTSDDQAAFAETHGNPLPFCLSNMVARALAPDHRLSVGWNGCGAKPSAGEIYRWYLEPGWLTAYGPDGKLHHVYTHSPPGAPYNVWQVLAEEAHAPGEKLRIYDKCFQLVEAIGVEKPIGPVFVCKHWTFADDKAGKAFRSDLYESFLTALRRNKVPISCAVHPDHEARLPSDLPVIYAPRNDTQGRVRFGFRARATEKWFVCESSEMADSLVALFASQLNEASENPIIFPSGTSVEGYAFEAKGMKFVVAEEMGGKKESGEIKVKVADGQWTVIDLIAAERLESNRDGDYIVFTASLEPNSATLYCVSRREGSER
jgi:hypothetical protein